MSTADLELELDAAVDGLGEDAVALLETAGVPREVLYHHPPLIGVSGIECHQGGLYEPASADGKNPALLVGCYSRNWGLKDIAAFHQVRPGRWWRRRGAADLLGEPEMGCFRVEPLVVHATPIAWLKAGCRGLVLLDHAADPLDVFMGAGPIRTDPANFRKMKKRVVQVAAAKLEACFNA